MAVSHRTYDRLVETDVGNHEHRLYGGSQYHRCLREFHLAVKCLRLPTITEDEIANAAGIGTTHDGVNFLHAACSISLIKARQSFEPMLDALRFRMTHVMSRLCPVAEYMLQDNQRSRDTTMNVDEDESNDAESVLSAVTDISRNPQYRKLIRACFEKFVTQCSNSVSIFNLSLFSYR